VPYTAEISRTNPSCFLFLIDRSASMSDPFGGEAGASKAQGVADAINRMLQSLVLRCAKGESVLDRYHVGVIGYGGTTVGPALGGPLAGRPLVPISELANNPLRMDTRTKKVPDGAGGLVEQQVKFPVWFEPAADGNTPMCAALQLAHKTASEFLARSPRCFPPILINITDGEANDGQPEPAAEAVRKLTSEDGNVLLFNVHLSSAAGKSVEYPGSEEGLPDDFARLLFRMSSVLPEPMRDTAAREGFPVTATSRGFVFNGNLVSVIQFLDIGTRVDRNLR
jgi:hypothetical protein